MTPADVVAEVRVLIQDSRSQTRYTDAVLLKFVNQTLKRVALLRPDLFAYIGDIPLTSGSAIQSTPGDSGRLIEIFGVKGGSSMTEISRDMLDMNYPGWISSPVGVPVNFARHVRNGNRFFVYPRPIAGIILDGEYVQIPRNYAFSDTIALLPDTYFPALVDGVVYLAESVDDEHVNSNRAKLFQDSFAQTLGVNLQARVVTDTEEGGLDPKQVI